MAHVLCREMAAHPSAVAGAAVLELGAGTGVCGLLAARLGAARVVLTDYTDGVLRNLRDCMHLNAGGAAASGGGQQRARSEGEGQGRGRASQQQQGQERREERAGAGSDAGSEGLAWEAGGVEVRYLDWADSLLAVGSAAPSLGRTIAAASHTSLDSLDRASNDSGAPGLAPEERFGLVLGTGGWVGGWGL